MNQAATTITEINTIRTFIESHSTHLIELVFSYILPVAPHHKDYLHILIRSSFTRLIADPGNSDPIKRLLGWVRVLIRQAPFCTAERQE